MTARKNRKPGGRRPGRPREIGVIRPAETRVRIQLPPHIYDYYCLPAVRRGWHVSSLIREVLIRVARRRGSPDLDFQGSQKSPAPPSV